MADLKTFTRDLVGQMEKDLGTKLDWVAVDHWNTDNPHVHIILRGRADDGQDLVISRDYIKEGCAPARDLVTQELGPRTDLEIRRDLERQVEAERWTSSTASSPRRLSHGRHRHGARSRPSPTNSRAQGRRLRWNLGLADQVGPGQWAIDDKAEATLRELGERGDIIKRMHRA
jgi:type IV secretory pathway VirD2 relaxase